MDRPIYHVPRAKSSFAIDADWNKPVWRDAPTLEASNFMGDRPAHLPRTQAKLVYDDSCLYVMFRVEDQFVRAVAERHQEPVYKDSCVEFFFCPGLDTTIGYFNLEMNCGGITLFHFQQTPRRNPIPVMPSDLARLEIAHSMPRRVIPEIIIPTTWFVECKIPFEILGSYIPAGIRPAASISWKANFYKCADESSQPHWLTWSPVDHPTPDFHRPEAFGILSFE